MGLVQGLQMGNNPRHDKKECRRNRSRDRDASWTWDHHREKYVYGYKVHVVIDSDSGLPHAYHNKSGLRRE
jgi:hypothetical protein